MHTLLCTHCRGVNSQSYTLSHFLFHTAPTHAHTHLPMCSSLLPPPPSLHPVASDHSAIVKETAPTRVTVCQGRLLWRGQCGGEMDVHAVHRGRTLISHSNVMYPAGSQTQSYTTFWSYGRELECCFRTQRKSGSACMMHTFSIHVQTLWLLSPGTKGESVLINFMTPN